MNAARPVEAWLQDPQTSPALRRRLTLARELRDYASRELELPDNASYRRYADLRRRAAVWNVAAAPDDALELKSWCFLVLGCVSYRGYFDEAQALALGKELHNSGWEVDVYPVPAYSTLGWLNWLGGDPLLSTFTAYPDGLLAGLLFHELAHQQLYADHDTAFNESFASAVEQLGVRQWLRTQPESVRQAHAQAVRHRDDFRVLQQQMRAQLVAVYAQKDLSKPERLARKAQVMHSFHAQYQALKSAWAAAGEPDTRYDAWVAKANNASFGLLTAYQGWVPAFTHLFVRQGCDWPRFYAAAAALAELPRAERDAQLQTLMPATLEMPANLRPPVTTSAKAMDLLADAVQCDRD